MRNVALRVLVVLLLFGLAVARSPIAAAVQTVMAPVMLVRATPAPAVAVPAAPPLPLGTANRLRSAIKPAATTRGVWTQAFGLRRPPIPALGLALKSAKRAKMSATGASIILTGDAYNAFLQNITLAYNTDVYPSCTNMSPNKSYRWVIFPPNGTSYTSAAFTVSAAGQCPVNNPVYNFNFYTGTPFAAGQLTGTTTSASPGTDAAYSGVWALTLQNMSVAGNPYDTIQYLVVIGGRTLSTYVDSGYSHAQTQFTPGSTVYVSASGLDPTHSYAYGVVNSSLSPLSCVATIPAVGTPSQPNCFVTGTTAGIPAPSGTFSSSWTTAGGQATGAYTIELWDATTHDLLTTEQVAVQPSSVTWTLVPYSGAVNGTDLGDTFATDALIDQSTAGVSFTASGLPSNDKLTFTLSDPGSFVFTPTYSSQVQAAPQQVTPVGNVATVGKVAFPLNAALTLGTGPTFLAYAPNVYTAQLYDSTTNKVVASKTYTVLAYQSAFTWSSPATTAANGSTTAPGAAQTVTVTNNGGPAFGTWNTDGIVGFKISPSGNGETISLPVGTTTATDTVGDTWNLTTAAGVITATIASGAMPDGASVPIPVNVLVPAGKCPSGCTAKTQILPQHGVVYSAANTATNGLIVIPAATSPNSVVSTETLAVTAGPAAVGTPRFAQMMYVEGTAGTTSANTYTLQFTIVNNDPTNDIMDFLVTMPTSYDSNTPPAPTANTVTVNGVNQNAKWSLLQQQAMAGTVNLENQFAFTCNGTAKNSCGIPPGGTGVFSINLPILNQSQPYAQIPITVNFDGGCKTGTGNAACGLTANRLSPTTTVSNAPIGANNLDSTELGIYSLNPAKMQATFNPSTIGAVATASTTFTFTNTSTVVDPYPDYIDELKMTMPAAMDPGAGKITPPAGWVQISRTVGTNDVYVWGLCATPPCASETNAIAPGASGSFVFNYTASPAAGIYNLEWQVVGANGGATVPTAASATYEATLVTTGLAASVQFTGAGGYPTATATTNGTEPSVGSDANATYGNAYTYRILNTATPNISKVVMTIPWQTSIGTTGVDSSGVDWTLTPGTPAITVSGTGSGAAPGCTTAGATVVQPNASSSTNGSITLTNCAMTDGQYIDIAFTAHAPYDINSEFIFPTTIYSGAASVVATPVWPTADYIEVVLDAKLTINIPSVGSPLALPNPTAGGSTPTTSCPITCTYTAGVTPTVNFGTLTPGVMSSNDLINVSIQSDAGSSANGWQLYVSADSNPVNASTSQPELGTFVDSTNTKAPTGANYSVVTAGPTYTSIPAIASPSAGNPGLSLAKYNGTIATRSSIDSIMSYQLTTTGDLSGANTVTLTYTLIPF